VCSSDLDSLISSVITEVCDAATTQLP
jgi:hypothetical protein